MCSNFVHPETMEKPGPVFFTIKIRQNLFDITLLFKSDSKYSVSYTVHTWPSVNRRRDLHQLWYIFENETRVPIRGDTPKHEGAAVLSIDFKKPLKMTGVYWTNRNWWIRNNTAGSMLLKKMPSTKLQRAPDHEFLGISANIGEVCDNYLLYE